jgi:hypothetical protein
MEKEPKLPAVRSIAWLDVFTLVSVRDVNVVRRIRLVHLANEVRLATDLDEQAPHSHVASINGNIFARDITHAEVEAMPPAGLSFDRAVDREKRVHNALTVNVHVRQAQIEGECLTRIGIGCENDTCRRYAPGNQQKCAEED